MASTRQPSGGKGGRAKKTTAHLRAPSKKKTAAKRRAPAKKKRPKKKAARKRARKPATYEPATGFWPTLCRLLISAVLTYLVAVTTLTFLQSIGAVQDFRFWSNAPVYFFALGVAMLPILLWGFGEALLYLYVFGHEITHVIFIYLCGGKVYGDIRVSVRGGHVVTDKTNWLISLSPYFVPFYTMIVASGFLLARLAVDLSTEFQFGSIQFQPLFLLYALIGFTWAMHIYYTLAMLGRDQPDLRTNGILLSLLVIILVNSLIVMGFLALASDTISFRGYIVSWFSNSTEVINRALIWIAGLIW